MDSSLHFNDTPIRDGSIRLGMLLDHVYTFNDCSVVGFQYLQYLPLCSPGVARDNLYQIPCPDFNLMCRCLCLSHNYDTSGANDTIFMNCFSRNSRATGPKIRVPRGSS